MRLKFLLVSWLLAASMAVAQQTPAPVLFFSDLILGANTGNSDTTYAIPSGSTTRGVYVELYGNYLSNYSSITLGSCAVTVVSAPATYLWYQRMIVMIGNNCSTGNWSITTPGGTFTGPMPSTTKEQRTFDFTVVSGHIYYIATGGSGTGTFSSPWGSTSSAQTSMADGDVTYIENGYSNSSLGPNQSNVIDPSSSQCASSTTSQRAIVAYPGATVTLGSTSVGYAAFINYSVPCNGYEIAEMTLRSQDNALGATAGGTTCPSDCTYNMRFIANDLSCPTPGSGAETGCEADGGGAGPGNDETIVVGLIQYGEYIHNTGNAPSNTLYHAIYHGTTTSVIDAWGYINPTLGGAAGVWDGIQMYTSASWAFLGGDYHTHDMWITNTAGHGLLVADNNDPAQSGTYGGGVEAYNNVIWTTGTGGSDNDCIAYNGIYPSGSTPAQFYNNTLYNCGASTSGDGIDTGYYAGTCTSSTCILNIDNNVDYQTSGTYVSNGGSTGQLTGKNNDFYGVGSPGSQCSSCTGTLNSNPDFTSTSTPNFVPLSGSPLIGAGTTTSPVPTYDITGLVRPSPPSIGAYEYAAGVGDSPPTPPSGLTAVVN